MVTVNVQFTEVASSALQFEKHAGGGVEEPERPQQRHLTLRVLPRAQGGARLEQQPASRELDGLHAVDLTAEQESQTLGMLTEEERAGLCLLDLRASSSSTESDPMHGVEVPAAEEIENVARDDQAMPDEEEIRHAVGERPRDSCLSTSTPVKVRVTETKYQPESFLKDVRGLLSTGLLEGFRVTYKKNEVEMTGRIKGQGYTCGCSECGHNNTMNACEFEHHSGESSNNQNDHIFLDSGISLYRVIQALKFTRLYLLGDLIEEQIGLPPNLVQYEKWKASFQVEKNNFVSAASDPCSTQSGCMPNSRACWSDFCMVFYGGSWTGINGWEGPGKAVVCVAVVIVLICAIVV